MATPRCRPIGRCLLLVGDPPEEGQAGQVEHVVGLAQARRRAPHHVHDGGAGHHQPEGGDHREQAPRPGGLPRRDEQPHGERDVEGAELARDVHGRAGVLAEEQCGSRQDQLGERHHEQRPPGGADRLAPGLLAAGARRGAEDGGR